MSDKLQFTPGPWKISEYPPKSGSASRMIASDADWPIADVYFDSERDVANANLIAAAPELYEALKEIIACDDATWKSERHFLIGDRIGLMARKAIDKAEGMAI